MTAPASVWCEIAQGSIWRARRVSLVKRGRGAVSTGEQSVALVEQTQPVALVERTGGGRWADLAARLVPDRGRGAGGGGARRQAVAGRVPAAGEALHSFARNPPCSPPCGPPCGWIIEGSQAEQAPAVAGRAPVQAEVRGVAALLASVGEPCILLLHGGLCGGWYEMRDYVTFLPHAPVEAEVGGVAAVEGCRQVVEVQPQPCRAASDTRQYANIHRV